MTNGEIQNPLNMPAAKQVEDHISVVLEQISSHELRLASNYARLGNLLREVKVNGFWQAYGYDRFSSYLEFVRQKIDRRRSQLYAILSVSECLLPYLTEEQLETIGITKAHELRRLVNEGGNLNAVLAISGDGVELGLLDFASDRTTTAIKLRAAVNNILHVKEGPLGHWVDFGGAYLLPDEKKEIEAFWELGRKVLQIGAEESEHEAKKQVMLAAARECVSTWAEDANAGR